MKVVQTVVCSTFTRGAKPATRRVADGERMNPKGRMARSRQYRGDVEDQGDEHPENGPGGGLRPRAPVRMASSAPLFHPLTSYADAAGSSLHQHGEPRTPS